jgi:hypothetical protein
MSARTPPRPAGVRHVSVVSSITFTLAAAAPSKVTVLVPAPSARKSLPRSVTSVPPRAGPAAGSMDASASPDTKR